MLKLSGFYLTLHHHIMLQPFGLDAPWACLKCSWPMLRRVSFVTLLLPLQASLMWLVSGIGTSQQIVSEEEVQIILSCQFLHSM